MGKKGAFWGRASFAFVGARLSCLARDGGRGVERDKIVRQVRGGRRRVEATSTPLRRVSRCPKAVARDRGGNLRTRVWVKRGIPWIYPRERARRKEDREGEPKQR